MTLGIAVVALLINLSAGTVSAAEDHPQQVTVNGKSYHWPKAPVVVVLIELLVIAWVRRRYMDTPWGSALVQVIIGGILVFLTGVLIGAS